MGFAVSKKTSAPQPPPVVSEAQQPLSVVPPPRRGRKKLPDGEKKSEMIVVACTQATKDYIYKVAAKHALLAPEFLRRAAVVAERHGEEIDLMGTGPIVELGEAVKG